MCASETTYKVNEGFEECFVLFDLIYDRSLRS